MSSLDAMRVLLFAGEALAASALVMLIVWLAAGQAVASRRHLTWAAGFAALLALPVLAAVAPSLIHFTVAVPAESAPAFIPIAAHANAHIYTTAYIPAPPAPSAVFALDAAAFVKLLFAVWLAGVAAIAGRGLFAVYALHRLRANSEPHRFGHLPIDGPRCELRLSTAADDARGPITWGVLRPVILLPHESLNWPRERVDAVLRHELAHVARRDCLTQMLALAVCALYWPNPLVWLGAGRLRREAEMAADDAVIVSGVRPSTYASALLRIANDFRGQPLPRMPLAMAAPTALEARVQSVLAPTQLRSGVTSMDIIKIAGVGLAATLMMAFARPSLAEDTPPPPAPPKVERAVPALSALTEVSDVAELPGGAPVTPATPAPVSQPVAPVPPVAPVSRHHRSHENEIVYESDDGNVRIIRSGELTAADRERVRAEIRKAHAAVEAARPQIEKAIREQHVAERAAAAIRAERPRIEAQVRAAQRTAMVEVDRALAEARVALANAHVDAKTHAAIERAFQAASANFNERNIELNIDRNIDKNIDKHVELHIDRDDNGANESDDSADQDDNNDSGDDTSNN